MQCTTIREGHDCTFMAKKGCTYNGGSCHEIVDQCDGCDRTVSFESAMYCSAAPQPSLKWKNGSICNLATHVKAESTTKQVKINPLKASKRAAKG